MFVLIRPKPIFHSVEHEIDSPVDAELAVDRRQVIAERMLANVQRRSDNLVRSAWLTRDRGDYFMFRRRERRMTWLFALPCASPCKRLQNSAHRSAVEPRFAGMHTFNRFQDQLC